MAVSAIADMCTLVLNRTISASQKPSYRYVSHMASNALQIRFFAIFRSQVHTVCSYSRQMQFVQR